MLQIINFTVLSFNLYIIHQDPKISYLCSQFFHLSLHDLICRFISRNRLQSGVCQLLHTIALVNRRCQLRLELSYGYFHQLPPHSILFFNSWVSLVNCSIWSSCSWICVSYYSSQINRAAYILNEQFLLVDFALIVLNGSRFCCCWLLTHRIQLFLDQNGGKNTNLFLHGCIFFIHTFQFFYFIFI